MKTRRPIIVFTVSNDLNFDQRMQRICSSLQKNGFDCLLVGRLKRDSKPLSEQIFEQKRLYCFFEKGPLFYVEFNIRLLFFLFAKRLFLKSFFSKNEGGKSWESEAAGARLRLVPAMESLIFYAVDLDTIAPVWLAGRLLGVRLFYDAHEYFSEVPEVVGRPFVKKIWEAVARFFIPKMDVHLTVGAALAKALSARYSVDFQVVRNVPFRNIGCRISDFGAAEKTKILLYQGALNAGRGLEMAISAMPFLPSEIEFWLAGEGDLSQDLRQLAREKRVENRVRFLGFVRPSDLPALTRKAWLGLNLLEDRGLSYRLSLANKFFDYIQNGVPSLNMNFEEYAAINSEFEVSFLLSELSETTICEAIFRIMRDESFYIKLQKNCLRAADVFCWENEEKKLLELFEK